MEEKGEHCAFLEAIVYVINIKQVVADPDLVIAGDSERI